MRLLFILLATLLPLLAEIGSITALQGEADILRQTQKIPAKKGTAIVTKDLLTTQAKSKVQVILNDDTVITIGPKSEYIFENYNGTSDPHALMQLKRGFFKTVTGKIGKIAPQRFKIKTQAATIGVRGTQFMAYIEENLDEHIACIQGKIIVWTAEGEFSVKAGKMLHYKDKHWYLDELKMETFAPVMIGMALDEKQKTKSFAFMPNLENNYLLEEQIINANLHGIDQNHIDPFTFGFNFDASQQPPPYNP